MHNKEEKFNDEKWLGKYRIPSARHPCWDYSSDGIYFVTICTKDKVWYFGEIINGQMMFSEIGKVACRYWLEIPKHFPNVILDEWIIMPNHVHGIIVIDNEDVETQNVETQNFASLRREYKNKFGPQSRNLSSIIRGFKAGVKKYATMNNINFVWQPRFYDRIIRTETELINVRNYIYNNIPQWYNDRNNTQNLFM